MKRKSKGWLLPLAFLSGFICAWGTISIDRHMVIEEQQELRKELKRTRIELRISKMMKEYGDDWQEMAIWNKEAIKPTEEIGK